MTEIALMLKEMLTWIKDNPRLTLVLILLLGSNVAVYHFSTEFVTAKYEKKISDMQKDGAEALTKAQQDNDDLKRKLQGGLNEANQRNAALNTELSGVRLQLRSCKGGTSGATGSGVHTAPGGGTLPEDPQAKLDRVAASLIAESKLADDVVEECRVVKEWAKAQVKQGD